MCIKTTTKTAEPKSDNYVHQNNRTAEPKADNYVRENHRKNS